MKNHSFNLFPLNNWLWRDGAIPKLDEISPNSNIDTHDFLKCLAENSYPNQNFDCSAVKFPGCDRELGDCSIAMNFVSRLQRRMELDNQHPQHSTLLPLRLEAPQDEFCWMI